MLKVENYRVKLFAYFTEIKSVPFNKDTNNCAHFVANGLQIIFAMDVFAKYRKYKTFEAQLKAMKKSGFQDHTEFLASIFIELEHPSQAKIGDIAVFNVDDELGVAVGFVFSENCFVMRENGLAIFPLMNAIRVFSI